MSHNEDVSHDEALNSVTLGREGGDTLPWDSGHVLAFMMHNKHTFLFSIFIVTVVIWDLKKAGENDLVVERMGAKCNCITP